MVRALGRTQQDAIGKKKQEAIRKGIYKKAENEEAISLLRFLLLIWAMQYDSAQPGIG